jgi:hypothetical protein
MAGSERVGARRRASGIAPVLASTTLLVLAACGTAKHVSESDSPVSGPRPVPASTPRSARASISDGIVEVCGVTALAGGSLAGTGVKDPVLLHRCPSGQRSNCPTFSLESSRGKSYVASTFKNGGWTASLPAGTYRFTDVTGCPAGPSGTPLVVTGVEPLFGVVVWWGCDFD